MTATGVCCPDCGSPGTPFNQCQNLWHIELRSTDAGRVWMATERRGLAYHAVEGRRTTCGRFVGDVVDGKPAQGVLLSLDEATLIGAVECARCAAGPTPFVVSPDRQRRARP
jgi:hypothetical protein